MAWNDVGGFAGGFASLSVAASLPGIVFLLQQHNYCAQFRRVRYSEGSQELQITLQRKEHTNQS